MVKEVTELEKAIAKYKEIKKKKSGSQRVSLEEVVKLRKKFKATVDSTKREIQEMEGKNTCVRPSRTRSGLKRGAVKNLPEFTDGKHILKGMDDVAEDFHDDELEFLEKDILKINQVKDLKYEHLKFLIKYKFIDDLRKVKAGELESNFHDRYMELKGRCINELYAEMRMTLFKSEQRDYIRGFLQGIFGANKKNENGDIKHFEINYCGTVMLYETLWRITQFVHQIPSKEETLKFMKRKSREAHEISEDED